MPQSFGSNGEVLSKMKMELNELVSNNSDACEIQ